ncbi:hypothetical protein [Alicyclobacillus suci]|nr:hypothetical protein [Alicyclobacillus suci]
MNFERLADTLKALADPTRLKVIALLNIQTGMFASWCPCLGFCGLRFPST